jgi:hypothetical protein
LTKTDLSLVNTEPFSGNNTDSKNNNNNNNNKSWLVCNPQQQQQPQIGLHGLGRLCMPDLMLQSPNQPLEERMCKKVLQFVCKKPRI